MRSRCATQYPIVLIHGSGYRDNNKIGYWGRIPAALREEGAQVYCSRQDAWGALETNVELLKDNILHALSDAGADKVNLIAHSRGGIEARQVIHHPMLTGKIASLTTISTPHHGSRTMDALTKPPQWMHKFLSLFVNGWFRLWGDKHPDFFTRADSLPLPGARSSTAPAPMIRMFTIRVMRVRCPAAAATG